MLQNSLKAMIMCESINTFGIGLQHSFGWINDLCYLLDILLIKISNEVNYGSLYNHLFGVVMIELMYCSISFEVTICCNVVICYCDSISKNMITLFFKMLSCLGTRNNRCLGISWMHLICIILYIVSFALVAWDFTILPCLCAPIMLVSLGSMNKNVDDQKNWCDHFCAQYDDWKQ
jgi:hypothetical protein